MTPLASTITSAEFTQLLTRYANAVIAATRPNAKPEPVATLDSWRRTELPATIASRSPPHMTKAELYRLVDCKLKRGKNRPILRLIEGNAEDFVVSTTTAAFAGDIRTSFATLLALRGVGPATASYLLAAHRFPHVPVFSDEAFRWVVHDADWMAKIRYDANEYWDFYEKVQKIAARLEVDEEDVERVGFVLGREALENGNGKTTSSSAVAAPVADGAPTAAGKKRKSAAETREHEDEFAANKVKAGGNTKRQRSKKTATTTDLQPEVSAASTTRSSSSRVLRSRKTAGNGA